MGFMYYLLSPFSWLLNFFYSIFDSYGWALICFALVVKLILFPFSLKGKRSMIQMNMISGKMQQLQKQYGKDRDRYNEEVQKLYAREKINPMGGCLWSLLPLLILLPLYAIIREPLHYMMAMSTDQITLVANAVDWQTLAVNNHWVTAEAMAKLVEQVNSGAITSVYQNTGYNQLFLASLVNEQTLPAIHAALGETTKVFAMNFSFLGLNLAMLPTWKIWTNPNWPTIGAFLLVVISAVSGLFFSRISMKTNQMNNQNSNAQMERTNKIMMWTMPIMSLYIGFIMPAGLCLYWIANNLLSMVQEMVAGKMLKKDYEAARVAALEREREEKEAEKRRKAEAAEERARRIEEEKKNRGKKKTSLKKQEDQTPGINKSDSRVGIRAYARGRAYDPNRFGGVTEYRDPSSPAAQAAEKEMAERPEEEKNALQGQLTEQATVQAQEENTDKEGT